MLTVQRPEARGEAPTQSVGPNLGLSVCLSVSHTVLTSCVTLSNPGPLGFSFCNTRGQIGGFQSLLSLGISSRY